jgi:hypothetical protein
MEMFACFEEAKLGLGIDMATGTGWPFAGPGSMTAMPVNTSRIKKRL